ncbi:MAG: hypothetical protein WAV23_02840 [Minisyncoccia bacterium]
MKAIIKDYITILKEDGELDTLLVNLLFHMNMEPKSRPQKGRQHGVDIMAVGIDPEDGIKKIFLLSVKRGNLDRNNWNSGKNDIKASLDDIFDVYIPSNIAKEYKKLPIKIIFALNGIIEQTAIPAWNGYKNKNSTKKIHLVDWDVDKITLLSEQYLFNESLLPDSSLLLLRKSLAFIDISDYDLSHVVELFNNILFKYKSVQAKTSEKYKRLSLLNVCTNIIFVWAQEQNNIRNALLTAEKATLLAWRFILEEHGMNDNKLIRQFIGITETLINIQHSYAEKTIKYCAVKDSFASVSRANQTEYSLVCYEYIGIMSTIGLNYYYLGETLKVQDNNDVIKFHVDSINSMISVFSNSIDEFINNNAGCNYPVYDSHSIEINLGFLFLYKTDRLDTIRIWLKRIIITMEITYSRTSFFPLFYENHDKLIEAKVYGETEKPQSSILLTVLAEWCIILNSSDLYSDIRRMVKLHFPEINLQLWYPDIEIEKSLFIKNSDQNHGKTKHSIELYDNIEDYKDEMVQEISMKNLSPELELEIFKNGLPFMGLLASRHYRTMVFPYYWRSLLQ